MDWQVVDIAPGNTNLSVGDQIKLDVVAAGCSQGGHKGWVYVDAFGSFIPGLNISGNGSASVNAGMDITYHLTYRNGGNVTENNSVATIAVPAQTTFKSVNGGCTNNSGTITCPIGTLAPGASGTVDLVVTSSGGLTAGSTVTLGSYSISSTTSPSLAGQPIFTSITNLPTTDLGITISDGVSKVLAGQNLTYTMTVSNLGAAASSPSTIATSLPTASLQNITWTCSGSGGGTCSASGSGDVNDTSVNLPVSGSVVYTIHARVSAGASYPIRATGSVAASGSVIDIDDSNNEATDSDAQMVAPSSFSSWNAPDGTVGSAYSFTFASNGDAPLTYTLASGSLPPGLSLSSAGVLSGTPTTAGTYSNLSVKAENVAGSTTSSTFDILINKVTPSVNISTNPVSPAYPNHFDVTVTVSSPAGTPGGTVNISDGHNSCSGAALSSGSATCDFVADSAGSRTITASYSGDGNFYSVSNVTSPLTIQKGAFTVTASFDQFTTVNTAAFKFNGAAGVNTSYNSIMLTPSSNGQYGTAWWLQKVNLGNQRSFSAFYSFFMRNGSSNAADGFTFAIQTQSNSAGSSGGGLGYSGIQPSFAVEYDTYDNPETDPNNNHVGIDVNGDTNSKWTTTPAWDLNNGTTYYSWVDYNGANDNLEIRLGTSPDRNSASVLYNATFASINGGTPLYNSVTSPDVYVGFTAGTGSERQEHHIGSFYFNNDYIAGGIQTNNVTYGAYPASISMSASPASIYATSPMTTGATSTTLTVCALDSSNNGMANQPITLSTSAGTLANTSLTTSGAGGCATTTLTANSVIQTATVHASATGGVNNTLNVDFAPTPPTAFLNAAPPDSVYYADYNFTFAANGYYTPTYSVVSGSVPIGLSLNANSGTLSGIPTVPGTFNFTVRATNAGGTYDKSYTIFIDKATTHLGLSSSVNPSIYGTNVTYTATLYVDAPSNATPVGPVQLSIDTVNYGSPINLNATGVGTRFVPFTALWPNDHAIKVDYTGSVNFKPSNKTITQTVYKATPVLTLIPTPTSMIYGESFGMDIKLAANPAYIGTPSGTVSLEINGGEAGSPMTLNAQGVAHIDGVSLPAGNNTINVVYSGDDYFANTIDEGTNPVVNPVTVDKSDTTTRIDSLSLTDLVVGQPTTVAVTVAPVAPGAGDPTGTVTVSNGTDQCNFTLIASDHGQGSCDLAATQTGSPDLSVTYIGDSNFNGSNQTGVSGPTVVKADSQFISKGFVSSSNVVVGQKVTVSVQLDAVEPGAGTPGGTVTVSNGTDSCEITLDESASGSCDITPTHVSTQALTWTYSGDERFNEVESSDPNLKATITQASTSTAISSSHSSSVYGEPVSFTATVSILAPGAGDLAGTVQFTIDDQPFGDPVNLAEGGVAHSDEINNLSIAGHTVSAAYGNDVNFADSTSAGLTQTVSQASATLVVVSPVNPSQYGDAVTVTAQVRPAAPSELIPTGSVQFKVNGVNYGAPVPMNASGDAVKVLPYTALWVGTHTITAYYSGDTHFAVANNSIDPLLQVVVNGFTTIEVTSTPAETYYAQNVSFDVSVIPADDNNGIPSGTVDVSIDGTPFESGLPLDVLGNVTTGTISTLSVGQHDVTVHYSGDDNYGGRTATVSDVHLVDLAEALLSVSTGATPVVGESYPVTVSLTPAHAESGNPTGTVTVSDGDNSCTITFNGVATSDTCNLQTMSVGSASISADYPGDDHFAGANDSTSLEVSQASTSVVVNTSRSPEQYGQDVTFTAVVSAANPGSGTPGGTVQFSLDGANLGSAVTLVNGQAGYTLSGKDAGSYSISAAYSGDADYLTSSATALTQEIDPLDTSVALTTSDSSAVYGQSLNFTATVTSADPAIIPQGSVQFSINGSGVGAPVSLDGEGVAEYGPVTNLPVAPANTVTATFIQNTDFNTSNGSYSQAVDSVDTSIELTSPYNPAPYGAPLQVTATVSANAPSAATPDGSVQFYLDASPLGSPVSLDEDGQALSPVLPAALGNYSLTAVYSGNASFNASSTASALDQSVVKADAAVHITTSSDPIEYGNNLTVTVQIDPVAPSLAAPSGTVLLKLNGVDFLGGARTLSGSKVNILVPYTSLWPDDHQLSASYSGDSYFNATNNFASPVTQTVQKATPIITAVTSATNIVSGQPIDLDVQVEPATAIVGGPSGSASLLINGVLSAGPSALDSQGKLTFHNMALQAGANNFSIVYGGDDYFAATTKPFSETITIAKADTTATITGFEPASVMVGQPFTASVQVTVNTPGSGAPSGTVTLSYAGQTCDAALTDGLGSCAMTLDAPTDVQNMSAVYAGDYNFNGSTAAPASGPQVGLGDAQMSVISWNPTDGITGQTLTLSVDISAKAPSTGAPSGTITLHYGDTSCQAAIIGGTASCDVTPLSAGPAQVWAEYSGDTNFAASELDRCGRSRDR